MARAILKALIVKGEQELILKSFASIPRPWQRKILKGMDTIQDRDVLEVLSTQ